MATVSFEEYKIAHWAWFNHAPDNLAYLRGWYRYLGTPRDLEFTDKVNQDTVVCTEDQARRIRMLSGPHAEAIIKAWIINHEPEHDNDPVA